MASDPFRDVDIVVYYVHLAYFEKTTEPQMTEKQQEKVKILDALHEHACTAGKTFYVDPETSREYFTEPYLKKRGYCCHTGCRHCPYSGGGSDYELEAQIVEDYSPEDD